VLQARATTRDATHTPFKRRALVLGSADSEMKASAAKAEPSARKFRALQPFKIAHLQFENMGGHLNQYINQVVSLISCNFRGRINADKRRFIILLMRPLSGLTKKNIFLSPVNDYFYRLLSG